MVLCEVWCFVCRLSGRDLAALMLIGSRALNSLLVIFSAVLSSGVVAAVFSSAFSEEKERWAFRRTKIEEIYMDAALWLREVHALALDLFHVCSGRMTFNQMLDAEIERGGKADEIGTLHVKFKMNMHIYEPGLLSAQSAFATELDKVMKLRFAVKSLYDETGQASDLKDIVRDQLAKLSASENELLSAILDRGREIADEPMLLFKVQKAVKLIMLKAQSLLSSIGIKIPS